MEKPYSIALDKTHKAYGKLAGTKGKPLVIIVHGLPCTINEGIYERACEYFQKAGYATYRFGLYDWQKDARQLIDCTLTIHAKDLDTVVVHFRRKGFKKIFGELHRGQVRITDFIVAPLPKSFSLTLPPMSSYYSIPRKTEWSYDGVRLLRGIDHY